MTKIKVERMSEGKEKPEGGGGEEQDNQVINNNNNSVKMEEEDGEGQGEEPLSINGDDGDLVLDEDGDGGMRMGEENNEEEEEDQEGDDSNSNSNNNNPNPVPNNVQGKSNNEGVEEEEDEYDDEEALLGELLKREETELMTELERDQEVLGTLILLKEKEWDAVLKLKKLKEIMIERIKRKREVESLMGGTGGGNRGGSPVPSKRRKISVTGTFAAGEIVSAGPSKNDELIMGKLFSQKYENETRSYLQKLEKQVQDLTKEIFGDGEETRFPWRYGSTRRGNSSALYATNALKSLVNSRNTPGKGYPAYGRTIGEGRLGAKLEVSTLIRDYRSKNTSQNDSCESNQKTAKRNIIYTPLKQPSTFCFSDMMTKMVSDCEKDGDPNASPPTTVLSVSTNNKTAANTKAKGNTTGGGGKLGNLVGTTLAKLLSSNNGSSGSRSMDEAPFNHKTSSNNSGGSDKHLSLANLLASSKARDDPPKKKSEATTTSAPSGPICQGCQTNKAQFVCAGCANQWYCSRDCQVAAWDDHSEVCSGSNKGVSRSRSDFPNEEDDDDDGYDYYCDHSQNYRQFANY